MQTQFLSVDFFKRQWQTIMGFLAIETRATYFLLWTEKLEEMGLVKVVLIYQNKKTSFSPGT